MSDSAIAAMTSAQYAYLDIEYTAKHTNEETLEETTTIEHEHYPVTFINTSLPALCYPRIHIDNPNVLLGEGDLSIQYGTKQLKQYDDYYILSNNDKYYITIRPETIITNAVLSE